MCPDSVAFDSYISLPILADQEEECGLSKDLFPMFWKTNPVLCSSELELYIATDNSDAQSTEDDESSYEYDLTFSASFDRTTSYQVVYGERFLPNSDMFANENE